MNAGFAQQLAEHACGISSSSTMSLEVSRIFATGLACLLVIGLGRTFTSLEDLREWRRTVLVSMCDVTSEIYMVRSFLAEDQSLDELHVLTMAMAVLCTLAASSDQNVMLPEDHGLPPPRHASSPQTIAEQVAVRWATWRSKAELWRPKIVGVLQEVRARPLLFQSTAGVLRLFNLWRTSLEDFLLAVDGLLARPATSHEGTGL